jgi:hypothetical protein
MSTENNTASNETPAPVPTATDLITSLFNDFLENGGSPKVTEFKRHLDRLINTDIKPMIGGRSTYYAQPGRPAHPGQGGQGSNWRNDVKARFSGRGAKWIRVEIDEVRPTLDSFDWDTSEYEDWIETQGFAWIRFNGPRIHQGQQCAAFEVRTIGSTYDCPKALHYIAINDLDDKVTHLWSTPHAMGLESSNRIRTAPAARPAQLAPSRPAPARVVAPVTDAEVVVPKAKPAIEVNPDIPMPEDDSPEAWNAYLSATAQDANPEEDGDEDIYGSFEG